MRKLPDKQLAHLRGSGWDAEPRLCCGLISAVSHNSALGIVMDKHGSQKLWFLGRWGWGRKSVVVSIVFMTLFILKHSFIFWVLWVVLVILMVWIFACRLVQFISEILLIPKGKVTNFIQHMWLWLCCMLTESISALYYMLSSVRFLFCSWRLSYSNTLIYTRQLLQSYLPDLLCTGIKQVWRQVHDLDLSDVRQSYKD